MPPWYTNVPDARRARSAVQQQPQPQQYTQTHNNPSPPEQDPQHSGTVTEAELPAFLQRGNQFQPREVPVSRRTLSPDMQKQSDRIDQYYQENPQPTEPAPPKSRINIPALIVAAFAGLSLLGIISTVMNFIYLRGDAKMDTSMSFIHAELALVFVTQILMFVTIKRGK